MGTERCNCKAGLLYLLNPCHPCNPRLNLFLPRREARKHAPPNGSPGSPLSSTVMVSPGSQSQRVGDENPVSRADQIRDTARRASQPERPGPERRDDISNRQFRRTWNTRVVRSKSMEPMSIGGRHHWFLKASRDFHGASIRI